MTGAEDYIDIANAFLHEKHTLVEKITSVEGGLINRTWKVKDKSGQFHILQRLNQQVFPEPKWILHNMKVVANQLSKSIYTGHILTPYQLSKESRNYAGEGWRMLPYVHHTTHITGVRQAESAARLLASFHQELSSLDMNQLKNTLPGFLDFSARLDAYQMALMNGLPERKVSANDAIQCIQDEMQVIHDFIPMYAASPKTVIHGDPKITNFLFDEKSTAIALIDWDTIMPGSVMYDLGDMIRSMCNKTKEDGIPTKNMFDVEVYHAILKGYLNVNHNDLINQADVSLAGRAIILLQAIRFLTDYLNGDKYYQVQYPEQNLTRTMNQLQLLHGMQLALNH